MKPKTCMNRKTGGGGGGGGGMTHMYTQTKKYNTQTVKDHRFISNVPTQEVFCWWCCVVSVCFSNRSFAMILLSQEVSLPVSPKLLHTTMLECVMEKPPQNVIL